MIAHKTVKYVNGLMISVWNVSLFKVHWNPYYLSGTIFILQINIHAVSLVISFQLIVWWWHYVLLKYKHFITFNFVWNSIAILITAVFLTETTMVFIRKQKKEKKDLCLTFWHKTTAQLSRSQGNTIPSNLQIQVTSFKIPLALLFKEL